MRGSRLADAWFTADPEGFAAAFRAYHAAVVPRAFFPRDEAHCFAAWQRSAILRRRRGGQLC
jgi:hypothetical protein